MELVKNASNRVSEFTNMLSIVTKLDALSQRELKQQLGIYASYGFEELKHLACALQDSCDAKLTPPAKSLQHFDELSSELQRKIKRYRAETMA
jgi:uncharacterized protein YceH (UPF0502 family)